MPGAIEADVAVGRAGITSVIPGTAGGEPSSVMANRRWRVAAMLAGVGDSVYTSLPLLVVGPLGRSVEVAAGALAAYTLGSMLSNMLLWGRLADRTSSPRALLLTGTIAQGALILLLAISPGIWGIVVLCAVIGVVSVSMDGAFARLVAGNLPSRERSTTFVVYSSMVERGVLIGFAAAALVLLSLGASGQGDLALRVVVGLQGIAVLAQALLMAIGPVPLRTAPITLARLASDGVFLLWASATGPFQRAVRVATRRSAPRGPRPLSDSLRLFLLNLVVLHAGYAMWGGLLSVFLREEVGLPDAYIMGLFVAGGFLTNAALARAGRWLVTVPAVQLLLVAASLRVAVFVAFAVLALFADSPWGLLPLVPLYLVAATAWGGVLAGNVAQISEIAPEHRRAEAMTLSNASVSGGVVIGTMLAGGVAATLGFAPVFALAAVVALVGGFLLLRW